MHKYQIDDNSGIPLWIQVRKRLVFLIISGFYKPGDQLPTIRELAVHLDVNYNTIIKVYQILEHDGYIITRRGKGTFVAKLDKKKLMALDNKVDLLSDELVEEGFDLGMTGDEILRIVSNRIELYIRHNRNGWSDSESPETDNNNTADVAPKKESLKSEYKAV